MGGRGASSGLTSMRQRAKSEIARMESEIERLRAKPGAVEGQGINRFISSSASAMRDKQRIRDLQNAIKSLREMFGV